MEPQELQNQNVQNNPAQSPAPEPVSAPVSTPEPISAPAPEQALIAEQKPEAAQKPKTAVIIGLIVGILLIVGIVIGFLLLSNSGNNSGGNSGGNSGDNSGDVNPATNDDTITKLQVSQRDTARRNDLAHLDTLLVQYQTNNRGLLPVGPSVYVPDVDSDEITDGTTVGTTAARDFIQNYMNSDMNSGTNDFKDPDGAFYSLYITEDLSEGDITLSSGPANLSGDKTNGYTIGSEFDQHMIYVVSGGRCNGEKVEPSTNKRHFAILYRLEEAGIYCIDNQ